jgi:cell division protein YceG involved in septum cleavage
VQYLYFVAGPDGRHVFSRTYNEHLRAIAKVRREK